MSPTLVVTIVIALAQLANLYLLLRVRTAILESEQRTMERVGCKYREAEVCEVKMGAIEHRVARLEQKPA